ncbi:hypothetical protein F4679DRAFT_600052 [Xylaria curta]|nr:hypothetical protein F4679DRAFT_600052 [Xylaria curta]
MSTSTPIRKNLATLSTKEKDDLVKAFKAIQDLDPDDSDSYFTIAGYHEILHCHHGDVLFPTWHRAYLCRLEKALQKKVPGVTLPYWDQFDRNQMPIPTILTDGTYRFTDGTEIPNPLYSYSFQAAVEDDGTGDGGHEEGLHEKSQDYATVRYPFSGSVSDKYKEKTERNNEEYKDMGTNETTTILNENVRNWLTQSSYINNEGQKLPAGVLYKYQNCLDAPNYTIFSNTTSSEQWNHDNPGKVTYSLENPHNNIHLALGGFKVPGQGSRNTIDFANGDTRENGTASFDPIFFFHLAWIDYLFWNWQERQSTNELTFLEHTYPGVDDYTPDSPLHPFKGPDGSPLTSNLVYNISDLGYAYDQKIPEAKFTLPVASPRLTIPKVSRRGISGSFVISVWVNTDNNKHDLIDADGILSRWDLSKCDNCQQHLEFQHFVPLLGWDKEAAEKSYRDKKLWYKVHTRQSPKGIPWYDFGDNMPKLELQTEGC